MTPPRPTHYEVLGVPSDATQAELRAAYLDLARRNHPDGLPTGADSAAARCTAEARMREVNAAWSALRTPVLRAAYDRALRGETPPTPGAPRPQAARTRPVRPGEPFPRPSAPVPPSAHSGSGVLGWTAVAALVVVLAGVLVFTAYANDRPDTGEPPPTVPAIQAGACVQVASLGGRVVALAVDCAAPGARRVAAVTDAGRPCPPPATAFAAPGERTQLCLAP